MTEYKVGENDLSEDALTQLARTRKLTEERMKMKKGTMEIYRRIKIKTPDVPQYLRTDGPEGGERIHISELSDSEIEALGKAMTAEMLRIANTHIDRDWETSGVLILILR